MQLDVGDLRSGTSVSQSISRLRGLAQDGTNLLARGEVPVVQAAYIHWVEAAEQELRSRFVPAAMWQALHTERYWRIRDLADSGLRPFPVISLEVEYQTQRLIELADALESWGLALAVGADCALVVPDTNVFMHCRRFDEIDWPTLVGARSVRLLLLLIVVDELDALAHRLTDGRGERARGVLRALQQARGHELPETPVDIRRHVSMQVVVDPLKHVRLAPADSEIVRWTHAIRTLSGAEPVLATLDYGMQLRATSMGVRFLMMPDKLRLKNAPEQPAASDSARPRTRDKETP